jgi:hypothetical protein
MAYSKAKLKSNDDKASPFQTIPNWKHPRQILTQPDSAVHFNTFLLPFQFLGDTKLNENILQSLSSD